MRHGLWAVALGVFLWTAPGRAADQYPRVALEVRRGEGTDGCIAADELDRAVALRLGREAFTPKNPVDLRLEVALEKRRPRGFSVVVVLEDAKGGEVGRRELETRGANCSSLDDSLALVVALLVDSPEAQQLAHANQPPAAPDAEATPAPAPARAHALAIPEDTPPRREPYRLDIAGALGGVYGELPSVALGGELFVFVRPPRFVELRLRGALFPAGQSVALRPGRGGSFSLAEVALGLCPLERELAALRLSVCVEQSIGRVRSAGFGFLRNTQADTVVVSLGAGASALYQLASPIFVLAGLDISAPIERNTYISRAPDGTAEQVFRASVVTAGAYGGLGVEL
jgi:hypothetical protein